MKCSTILICATGAALCALPSLVAAESSLQSGARTASVGASARLDFRIIIPAVLGLTVIDVGAAEAVDATVRVTSNGRQVSVSAGAPGSPEDHGTQGANAARAAYSGRVAAAVLRAPRHGVVQQYADCSIGMPRPLGGRALGGTSRVIDLAPLLCTASTP